MLNLRKICGKCGRLTKVVIVFLDLVSEYQQYQEATADDDEDEDGYDNGYADEVQEDD